MPLRTVVLVLLAVVSQFGVPARSLRAQDGFLFGHPGGHVTLRSGAMLHRAEGDLFDFFRDELTLSRGDFRAISANLELAIYLASRFDLAFGAGVSRTEADSEFREWVDQDDQPIEQTTLLQVVPITLSLRFYPLERGHRVSDLAWIPVRFVPYVGAGAGLSWYRLQQVGDFVADDLAVFFDDYRSSDLAPTLQGSVGVDYWLSNRFGLNLEGRYLHASATPVDDFVDWERLDLSGMQLAVGATLRW
jgi:hypothetical protein